MKKIVALVVVLALALTTMMPVLAASVQPRACSHVWLDLDTGTTGYVQIQGNNTHHKVVTYKQQMCTLCYTRQTNPYDAGVEPHAYGQVGWCGKCGYRQTGTISLMI